MKDVPKLRYVFNSIQQNCCKKMNIRCSHWMVPLCRFAKKEDIFKREIGQCKLLTRILLEQLPQA
ncbi:MAG: hypothetical protein DI538_07715 [Azospira oryzae]|jgi:hypothetical protein|nr:MAG: hypothetical protein DI538_07715 [Azospira oryzae]